MERFPDEAPRGDPARIRSSMQFGERDDNPAGQMAGLTHLLAGRSAVEKALSTARLSPRQATSTVVLMNDSLRDMPKPEKLENGAVDYWAHNEAGRIALLSAQVSISVGGRGRMEIVDAIAGITRFFRNLAGGGQPRQDGA